MLQFNEIVGRSVMSNNPILTNYVSEIDQLLQTFDEQNPVPSQSQRKERNKFLRITFLRDIADRPEKTPTLWESF